MAWRYKCISMVNEYLLLSNYGMTSVNIQMQSSKRKFEFTGPNQILEFTSILYLYLPVNKN